MSKAKEVNEQLSKGCLMYEPCPICFKCMVKGSHLYTKCEDCDVPFCGHNNKQRNMIIRRENFGITVTNETGEQFKALSEKCQCEQGE